MPTRPNKWTICLARLPISVRRDGMTVETEEGTFMISDVRLNGVMVRCTQVGMTMSPKAPVVLHLEIMPRDLEIIMAGDDGNQEA